MIVCFEGIWGTGKTTTAKKLAAQFNAEYIPEPDHKLLQKCPGNLDSWYRDSFYEIIDNCSETKLTFLDRSLASWAAFLMARDGKIHPNWHEKYPKLDFTIVLTAPAEHKLAITANDHPKFPKINYLRNNPQFVYSVEQNIIRFSRQISHKQLVVDTAKTPDSLIDEVRRSINEEFGNISNHHQIQPKYGSTNFR